MRVLVACEESQRVCTEFRKRGHEAYSCDILEPSGGHPEWHILGDAVPLVNGDCTFKTMDGAEHTIDGKWDLIIAHPPCTYLSNVATRQYSLKCNTAEKVVSRWEERARAAVFFMQFALADCDRIAVENPVGFMNSSYRKPDQIIHPYFFAESEDDAENYHEKRTCLWLKGLPQLERSNSLPPPPPMYILQGEKGKGKKIGWCEGMRNIKGGQAERAKARSKTFPGIAKAMAEQWGTIAADRKDEPTAYADGYADGQRDERERWERMADRKTENSSEKPNNCEHITEDGVTCARYPACDDCPDNPLNKVKGSERLVKGVGNPDRFRKE